MAATQAIPATTPAESPDIRGVAPVYVVLRKVTMKIYRTDAGDL